VEVAEKLSGDDIGVSPHYLKVAAIEAVLERAIHCSGGRQTFICTGRRMTDDVYLRIVNSNCRWELEKLSISLITKYWTFYVILNCSQKNSKI
jgi:hypothetical protein